MDISNILEIKLESNKSDFEMLIGKKYDYHLISISGLGTPDGDVNISNNVRYDGSRALSRRYRSRNIVMEIGYDGNYKLDARKEAIKFFNIHSNGYFSIRYGNDRYKIPYICENMTPALESTYHPFMFRVSLICPNPFFVDYSDSIANIVEWRKSLVFPVVIPEKRGLVFGKKKKRSFVNIYNAGDVDTGMIVTFKANGTVENPYILNAETREKIHIIKTMTTGEMFIVDTNAGNKGIEIINNPDGEKNAYRYLSEDSTFMQLVIGDNQIRYGADKNVDNLDVSIHYTNKYLGV